MKHSRGEIIKCIVAAYMKRRQYCDNENVRKNEIPLTRTAESCAFSGLVDIEASHPNSIMYKCVNNDPSVTDIQFSSLKSWINELECPQTSEELKVLLFPMLCHLYIEMLNGGHKTAASSFLVKHQSLSSEEGYELLEELASVDNTKEISERKVLATLRSSKCQVTLSPESIQILKQYLVKKSHVILLQIINSWFDLDELRHGDEPLLDLCDDNAVSQPNGYEDHPALTADNDLAKIEEIIRLVNEGPSSPSPLLTYSVFNPCESLSCGVVSSDGCLLAGGYTSSEVRMWSLTDDKLPKQRISPASRIRLAIDLEDISGDFPHVDDSAMKNMGGIFRSCESLELLGHSGTVQDVAFLPGLEYLVSVGMDKTMRVWNLQSQSCAAVFRGHNYPIWCVGVSPLPGFVATGSHDRTARLWSLQVNFPLRIFAGHLQDVDCLRFHPNGNYLATGSSDYSVRLWSVESGELVRVFDGSRAGIMALAFSPDGNKLASAGDDKRIKVWDLRNCTVLSELRGHTDCILSLDWSPNGDYLASCGADGTARIWGVRNISTDEGLSKVYNLRANSVSSINYSSRNTPMCVFGIK